MQMTETAFNRKNMAKYDEGSYLLQFSGYMSIMVLKVSSLVRSHYVALV